MFPSGFARGARRSLALAALGVLATGCSVAMMKPPPVDHQQRDDFYCDLHVGWPIADGVAAAVLLSAATSLGNGDTVGPAMLTAAERERGESPVRRQQDSAPRMVAAGATAVAAFSSLYGLYQANQCRQAVRLWQLRAGARAQDQARGGRGGGPGGPRTRSGRGGS